METDVFGYFVAIGAGLSLGLSLGFVPAVIVWRIIRKGGNVHARQTPKTRT